MLMQIYENKSLKDLEGELWKIIPDSKGRYSVSNFGRIRSEERWRDNGNGGYIQKQKIMTQADNTNGYLTLNLRFESCNPKHYYPHRLVAIVWIDNPNDYPEVNHIDGNKYNNLATNLEWCTSSYNKIHAINEGLRKAYFGDNPQSKKVWCIESGIVYDSIKRASIDKGLDYKKLRYMLSDSRSINKSTIRYWLG